MVIDIQIEYSTEAPDEGDHDGLGPLMDMARFLDQTVLKCSVGSNSWARFELPLYRVNYHFAEHRIIKRDHHMNPESGSLSIRDADSVHSLLKV